MSIKQKTTPEVTEQLIIEGLLKLIEQAEATNNNFDYCLDIAKLQQADKKEVLDLTHISPLSEKAPEVENFNVPENGEPAGKCPN